MDEICQDCGKTISRRARANVWNGDRIVCSRCYKVRKQRADFESRVPALRVAMVGWPDKPWIVHDGRQQSGPFTTDQLIALLRAGQVDWLWSVWREGMKEWKKPASLFTMPELTAGGEIRLRDFIQFNPAGEPEG